MIFRVLLFSLLLPIGVAHAAISPTNLATNGTNTDATSVATASISPSANTLILASIGSEVASGTANEPTASGNGLTWVVVATRVQGLHRITVFRALGASPSADALTFDFAGQTQLTFVWSVIEVSGADTSGANGSGAVIQSAVNSTSGTQVLTVTLGAFANTANATFGFFYIDANNGFTAGSGFAIVAQTSCCGSRQASEWVISNDTTVDITWGVSNATSAGIALEIQPPVASPFGVGGQFLSALEWLGSWLAPPDAEAAIPAAASADFRFALGYLVCDFYSDVVDDNATDTTVKLQECINDAS